MFHGGNIKAFPGSCNRYRDLRGTDFGVLGVGDRLQEKSPRSEGFSPVAQSLFKPESGDSEGNILRRTLLTSGSAACAPGDEA
jgi:hypothetical protein